MKHFKDINFQVQTVSNYKSVSYSFSISNCQGIFYKCSQKYMGLTFCLFCFSSLSKRPDAQSKSHQTRRQSTMLSPSWARLEPQILECATVDDESSKPTSLLLCCSASACEAKHGGYSQCFSCAILWCSYRLKLLEWLTAWNLPIL